MFYIISIFQQYKLYQLISSFSKEVWFLDSVHLHCTGFHLRKGLPLLRFVVEDEANLRTNDRRESFNNFVTPPYVLFHLHDFHRQIAESNRTNTAVFCLRKFCGFCTGRRA